MIEWLKRKTPNNSQVHFFQKKPIQKYDVTELNFFEYNLLNDKKFNKQVFLASMSLLTSYFLSCIIMMPSGTPVWGQNYFLGLDVASIYNASHLVMTLSSFIFFPTILRKIWGKKNKPFDYALSLFPTKLFLPSTIFIAVSFIVGAVSGHYVTINSHAGYRTNYPTLSEYKSLDATPSNVSLKFLSISHDHAMVNYNGKIMNVKAGDNIGHIYHINKISIENNQPIIEIENLQE